jgi:hypothetical protein
MCFKLKCLMLRVIPKTFSMERPSGHNTLEEFKIYTTRSEIFEKGETDPFGFDHLAEQLSSKYLPFPATVRKPAYFLFITYVNKILAEKLIPYKTIREKNNIRTRLEKLLVYCWKTQSTNLRGASVIGNRTPTDEIDPFSSAIWPKMHAFRIYTDPRFYPSLFERYWRQIGQDQVAYLRDFIETKRILKSDQEAYLGELTSTLVKRQYSLFKDHLLHPAYRRKAKTELAGKINRHHTNYFVFIKEFLEASRFNENRFWKNTLENKKLPFLSLNNWFSAVVKAVDADLEGQSHRKSLWNDADLQYTALSIDTITGPHVREIGRRPNKDKWFVRKKDSYAFADKLVRDQARWESYKKRPGEDANRYFFTFRHAALASLINESTF